MAKQPTTPFLNKIAVRVESTQRTDWDGLAYALAASLNKPVPVAVAFLATRRKMFSDHYAVNCAEMAIRFGEGKTVPVSDEVAWLSVKPSWYRSIYDLPLQDKTETDCANCERLRVAFNAKLFPIGCFVVCAVLLAYVLGTMSDHHILPPTTEVRR